MKMAILMGALGFGAMGLTTAMSMAPQGGGAISQVLAPHYERAQRRNWSETPVKRLAPDVIAASYFRGLVSEDQFFRMMAEHGYTTANANRLLRHARTSLTIEDGLHAYMHGIISQEEFFNIADRNGMTRTHSQIFLKSSYNPISSLDILKALWRGDIDRNEYYKQLKRLRYSRRDADILEQANFFYPPPSDLIRFQVREVFRDEVAEKFGYDDDYPAALEPHAAKIGIQPETLKQYWRAHWDLPSPMQVYEMLHRLHPEVLEHTAHTYDFSPEYMKECETTADTVDMFLKTANYPEYWRKRLKAISYRSLTRVDLRRIYELGLVNDDYVVATLREEGYSSYDATKLLEYFKRHKMRAPRDLTQAQLRTLFMHGVIDEARYKEQLTEMAFTPDEQELLILSSKLAIREKEIKELIKTLEMEYIEGIIDIDSVRSTLGQRGMEERIIRQYVTRFKRAKRRNIKHPPLRDVKGWLQRGVISEEKFTQIMSVIGYAKEYIELYLHERKLQLEEV